jgi:tetratricopeptide (TPR) repeat protein
MREKGAAVIVLAVMLVLLAAGFASAAGRAECLQRRHAAKEERSLLQRKALLAEALRVCPEDAELHRMYAFSLERLRKYEEALVHYAAAAALDPQDAGAFFGLGDIHLLLGNIDNSVEEYERGLVIEPANARARRSLAEARARLEAREATRGPTTESKEN